MRISWTAKAVAIWAMVLVGALRAAAFPIDGQVTAGDAADLADEINRGTASTLNVPAGTYSVTEPLYINRNLSLTGKPVGTPPLASEVIIRQSGSTTSGSCFGNALKDGDFELGTASPWTQTPSTPQVIVNSTADAQAGSWYALFNRTASTTTGVPAGAMDFTRNSPVDLTKYAGFPGAANEQLVWTNAMVPAKVNPFPIVLTHSQTLSINPGSYTQTLSLYGGAVGPVSITFWLYVPKYQPGDKLEIFDGTNVLPLVTPSTTAVAISDSALSVADYQSGFKFVKVDLSALSLTTHTISLVATLNSNTDDPSIFLVGAIVKRANTAASTVPPGGDVSDVIIDPQALSSSIITSPAFAYPVPQAYIPAGQAIGVAANPYPYATLLFGGICRPRLSFSASMPQNGGGTSEGIQAFYDDGSTKPAIGAALGSALLTPACQTFGGPLPLGLGKIAFNVNIDSTRPSPTMFVIDNVCVSVSSPALEAIAPVFAPKNCNILNPASNPDFESGNTGWTVTSASSIPLTLGNLLSTSGACTGTAALFNPLTLPVPPVNLYVWTQVVQQGTASDTLTVHVEDGTNIVDQPLLDGSASATTGFVMLPPVDLSIFAGKPVAITFRGNTNTNTTNPAIFALGCAELSNVKETGPDPMNPSMFIGGSLGYIEDSFLQTNSLAPAPSWTGMTPYVKPYRFGGIHVPAMKYQVSSPVKGDSGDLLNMLFAGNAVLLESPATVSSNCLIHDILLPAQWLGQTGAFGFESVIKDQTSSTVFELDNLCISHVSDALNALNPVAFPKCDMALLTEDFEGGGWTAQSQLGTVSPVIGPSTETPAPCDTTNVAIFKALPAPPTQTITLAQGSLQVVPQTKEMTFWVKMPAAGTPVDTLECITTLGSVDATVYTLKGDAGGYSSYKQETVDMSMYAGQTIALRFVAKLAESPTPASFALDSICLAPPAATAVLTVGAGVAVVSDLNVSGGTTAIQVKSGASLELYRCLVDKATVAGVQVDSSAGCAISESVFDGNTIGVNNVGGNAVIYQSTFLGGSTAVQGTGGTTKIAACLCRDAGIAGTVGVTTYINWVAGDNYGGASVGLANIPSTSISPVFLTTWPGKLAAVPLVQSGTPEATLSAAGFALPVQRTTDFEHDTRSAGNLGIGADEQYLVVPIQSWSYTVSPNAIGQGQTATVTVVTDVPDLTGRNLELRMVPEMPVYSATPYTADNTNPGQYIIVPLTVNPLNPQQAVASLSFSGPFNPAANGSTICTDGAMSFYLVQDGILVNVPPTSASPLVVDTVAPVMDLNNTPPQVLANDSTLGTEGPSGWPPLTMPIPMSGGNLVDKDVHWFIGKSPQILTAGLDLTIRATFTDQWPVDTLGQIYQVTTSGLAAPMAADLTGLPVTPTVTPTNVTVGTGPPALMVDWEFVGLNSTPQPMAFQPFGKDAVGNKAKLKFTTPVGTTITSLTHYMKVWWQTTVQARFDASSTPDRQQTNSPHFGWSVSPATGLTPVDEAPCYPAAAFQIWSIDPATTAGVSLTGGWTWVAGPIDVTTYVPIVDKKISQILSENRSSPSQSKLLMIALIGGDEAGNIQYYDPTWTAGFSTAGVFSGVVDVRSWQNGQGQSNVAVDTDLNVQLSHADKNGNIIGGRNFGSMARVPLPTYGEAAAGVHVAALVTLTAHYPEQMNAIVGNYSNANGSYARVEWRLYEDGALVAEGSAFPKDTAAVSAASAVGKPMQFVLPDLLMMNYQNSPVTVQFGTYDVVLNPSTMWNAFLRLGPDGVKNHLGDEGIPPPRGAARQREVHYMLVAQTVATIPSLNSYGGVSTQTITDPSPASVEFSIYVKDVLDKVREEQPVRIYERK